MLFERSLNWIVQQGCSEWGREVPLYQENVSRLAGKEIQVFPAGKVFPPGITPLGERGCRRFANPNGREGEARLDCLRP
jgi:hypothetical protein